MTIDPAYVLVHGGLQGGWVWEQTINALRAQVSDPVRLLAANVPGCGTKRGRDTTAIGPTEIATELIDDIEAAGLRDVVLVGHSQAGTILPALIAQRPTLFRRVIYVTCMAPQPGQTTLDYKGSLPPSDRVGTFDPADPRGSQVAMFCNDMSASATELFLDKLGADAWPQRTYEVSDWRYDHLDAVPASYVVCLRDVLLDPDWQAIFADRFGAERVVRIDAGHQVMNTRPHALAELLRFEATA